MTLSQLILSQLVDPFRIVLIAGLIYTMIRNRAVTGTWLPLAAGVVFVAVLLASTTAAHVEAPFVQKVGAGLVSNAILTGILLGLWEAVSRFRR